MSHPMHQETETEDKRGGDMSTDWKVQSNPVGGIMMYIPSRIIDPDKPEHSGNIEHYGAYTKNREEAQRIVDELNRKVPAPAAGELFQITMEAARVNAKLTQEEAAKRQGISRATLISWESGKTYPTIPKLNKMAEVYGISVNHIFLPT